MGSPAGIGEFHGRYKEGQVPKPTQRLVDSIRAGEARQTFWDDTLRGFGVRVTPPSLTNPKGTKSYVVKYRLASDRG